MSSMVELRAFLAEREDVQALKDLVDGDRLQMLDRVDGWMQKRCYLLDFRKLIYESLPMVVAAGPVIDGSEDMTEWIEGTIEIAAQALLEEDARLAREGTPLEEPIEPRYVFLMDTLMFTPEQVRIATVAANELRTGERHVFFNCFVVGKGFGRYEEETGIRAEQAQALLMRAIDRLCDAVGDE